MFNLICIWTGKVLKRLSFHTSDGPSSLGTATGKNPHRACQAVSAKKKSPEID